MEINKEEKEEAIDSFRTWLSDMRTSGMRYKEIIALVSKSVIWNLNEEEIRKLIVEAKRLESERKKGGKKYGKI